MILQYQPSYKLKLLFLRISLIFIPNSTNALLICQAKNIVGGRYRLGKASRHYRRLIQEKQYLSMDRLPTTLCTSINGGGWTTSPLGKSSVQKRQIWPWKKHGAICNEATSQSRNLATKNHFSRPPNSFHHVKKNCTNGHKKPRSMKFIYLKIGRHSEIVLSV